MTSSEKIFLMLCEELNFSKTAKKAFISQQTLSDHIARLEKKYGARLFVRKPRVALTRQGTALRNALLSIRQIEHGLDEELKEIELGKDGMIRVGMNLFMAQLIFPELYERYYTRYPYVLIDLFIGDYVDMQVKLDRGELDCFLCLNGSHGKNSTYETVYNDSVYLIVSNSCIREHPHLAEYNESVPADIGIVRDIPLIMDRSASTTAPLTRTLAQMQKVSLKTAVTMHAFDTSAILCRNINYGYFGNGLILKELTRRNAMYSVDKHLRGILIRGLEQSVHFELVYNKIRYYPQYALDFLDLLREVMDPKGI